MMTWPWQVSLFPSLNTQKNSRQLGTKGPKAYGTASMSLNKPGPADGEGLAQGRDFVRGISERPWMQLFLRRVTALPGESLEVSTDASEASEGTWAAPKEGAGSASCSGTDSYPSRCSSVPRCEVGSQGGPRGGWLRSECRYANCINPAFIIIFPGTLEAPAHSQAFQKEIRA